MKKILLVEDDLIFGETLQEVLSTQGFTCIWVKDGEAALDTTFASCYDLLLLDVNVPFVNGFELLKELRESGDKTPAIFITALIDTSSLAKGFDVGADDYIKKPFDIDELIIRMKALIKRSYDTYENELKYKNINFNIESGLVHVDGKKVHLPPAELALLKYFLRNCGKLLKKDEITDFLNLENEMSDGALRVHISHLKKLGLEITNIRGVGYRCEKL